MQEEVKSKTAEQSATELKVIEIGYRDKTTQEFGRFSWLERCTNTDKTPCLIFAFSKLD